MKVRRSIWQPPPPPRPTAVLAGKSHEGHRSRPGKWRRSARWNAYMPKLKRRPWWSQARHLEQSVRRLAEKYCWHMIDDEE